MKETKNYKLKNNNNNIYLLVTKQQFVLNGQSTIKQTEMALKQKRKRELKQF